MITHSHLHPHMNQHGHEQAPHVPTWSSHTLAVTSLLLARIKNHNRIAAALTANLPFIGHAPAPFTVRSVEDIEAYMKREKPNWMGDIEKMKADAEKKDIDKAVEYLEKGMLAAERVILPMEAACQRGLDNLTKVIIEIAGGPQQFDQPVKEEWDGRVDLVTPDCKGSLAGRMDGKNPHEGEGDAFQGPRAHRQGHRGHGFGQCGGVGSGLRHGHGGGCC